MSQTGRAIAGVAFLGIAAMIATGWWWPSTATADDEITEPVRFVEIDNDSGNVSVRADDVETTTVHQRFRYHWNEPDTAFTVEDGTLELNGCGWQCDIDYEVVVPLGATVSGTANSGNIELDGVSGVDVSADSGHVTLSGVDGPIKADADSGNISGEDVSGPIEVQADSGNIELTLAEPGDITARADSGTIELVLPDVAYQVSSQVDSGSEEIDVRTDPDSPYVLDLDADSGSIEVRTG
ncbi:MAG: DUF4097 family beta strand repeat protein [Actinophytocola sp.]|nr:DUF4097 family beta strand repeat protein [Actinophytocola sp.]